MVVLRKQQIARPRGFTLLELLLATSVLASMSVLMGTMLVQARNWREDGLRLHDSVALPRVTELLQRQWSQRRVLSDSGEGFDAEHGQLQFISSAPLLDPQWPLVRVMYKIELSTNQSLSGDAQWNLVYEEHPITDVVSGISGVGFAIARGAALHGNRMVLLESCAALRLEWFEKRVEDDGESFTQWVSIEGDDHAPASTAALRLIGSIQGEPFSCVLATQASRSSSF